MNVDLMKRLKRSTYKKEKGNWRRQETYPSMPGVEAGSFKGVMEDQVRKIRRWLLCGNIRCSRGAGERSSTSARGRRMERRLEFERGRGGGPSTAVHYCRELRNRFTYTF
jgi:hypothetical protein